MPYPPRQDSLVKLKFVTNYLLAGCSPPYDLILEFSERPLLNLLSIFLVPDPFDIMQAMFDPRHGRARKKGRHGRKKHRKPGIPDIDEAIGERLRVDEVAEAAQELPGFRVAVRLNNMAEGVALGAAVADALTDIAFDPLYAALMVRHDNCIDFDRLSRRTNGPQFCGLPGPDLYPIGISIKETDHGFYDSSFETNHAGGPWGIGISCTAKYTGGLGSSRGRLVLNSDTRGIIAASQFVDINEGGEVHLSCWASCNSGESVGWYWNSTFATVVIEKANVLAYGEYGWLNWL